MRYEGLLYGLAMACPLHNCDKSCPIDKIREMPIKERLNYLADLDEEERNKLLKKHNACIEQFEMKYFHNIA